MEDVCSFVNGEVGKRIFFGKVLWCDKAGGLLAEPNDVWRVVSQQFRAKAGQIQVRECPCRSIEALIEQKLFNLNSEVGRKLE